MSLSITVTPAQLGPAVARMFDELTTASREAAIKAIQRAAYLCQAEAVKAIGEVRPFQPVDTGVLKRSFIVATNPTGAVLENVAPHAVFMEFGTRPHWAPLSALEAWAERKLRGRIASKAGRANPARQLARAVQRKIAKVGTAPRSFYAAASLKFPGIVEEQIRFALSKLGGR